MCVKYGLPAQSPTAQTSFAVVCSRSLTLMCPRRPSRPRPSPGRCRRCSGSPAGARRCVPSIAPRRRVQANGLPRSPLDAVDGGPGQDLDPLVPEEALDRLGHVRVFAVDQRAVAFDDGHAAAEASDSLRQLEAHVAAAQDDQVSREAGPAPGPRRGSAGATPRGRGCHRSGPRPGVDHDGLAAERPGPARVERDLESLRRDEASVAHDDSAPLSRYFC